MSLNNGVTSCEFSIAFGVKIVEWQSNKYLDGGLSDSIPVDFAKSLGFDKLIVVLTRPIDYRKKPSNGRVYKLFTENTLSL